MRIIAGALAGRQFESPRSSRTHPMSEKVRGALFNMLGDITGLTLLDAYGGSGALSFEALSRGAAQATVVDNDKQAIRSITAAAQLLGLKDRLLIRFMPIMTWSGQFSAERFDLVLADPPFDQVKLQWLQQLATHVKTSGLLIVSLPADLVAPEFASLTRLKQKHYGDAQLVIYRHL